MDLSQRYSTYCTYCTDYMYCTYCIYTVCAVRTVRTAHYSIMHCTALASWSQRKIGCKQTFILRNKTKQHFGLFFVLDNHCQQFLMSHTELFNCSESKEFAEFINNLLFVQTLLETLTIMFVYHCFVVAIWCSGLVSVTEALSHHININICLYRYYTLYTIQSALPGNILDVWPKLVLSCRIFQITNFL